ncbi:helix-turn-helix transcriptional regulator [Streptomyces sp. NBC_01012]|uniref:YafY family transcriptional regulator n=1 Tax=Streptomyces sp. NBC_01401 TaxID=2903854 RepID=A0AAU3GXW0_9ACTN|nr:YafY family transcriptional regulator [Streptomyces sp. NBC_01012]
MISTSARLLRLVGLLSARPSWTNAELAGKMEVHERTVRRDVARLRELGYAVESDAGPWGGYRLQAGTRIPPLILDDDEALAVTVGLREAALGGVLGGDHSALSALLKLRQVLPPRMAIRLAEMDAALVHTPRTEEPQIASAMLLELTAACRRQERVTLTYRDREGRVTNREIAPYRLVHTARRWYFVAQDLARGDWRTFRADRVVRIRTTGRAAAISDPPDAARLVCESIPAGTFPLYTTVRVPLPMDRAVQLIPTTMGVHRPDGPDATLVEIGGYDAEDLARYLLSRATPLRVLSPDTVREALRQQVQELLQAL